MRHLFSREEKNLERKSIEEILQRPKILSECEPSEG